MIELSEETAKIAFQALLGATIKGGDAPVVAAALQEMQQKLQGAVKRGDIDEPKG